MNLKLNLDMVWPLTCCFFLCLACGKDNKSKSSRILIEQRQEEGNQGNYRAVLAPINSTISGETTATVEIIIEGDEFIVEANAAGAPPGVKHLQNIMTGGACPDVNSDINGDGVIDIIEAGSYFGQIFIPLDSNLSEQIAGKDYGPIANGSGRYVYRRSAALSMLLSDLTAVDPDTSDGMIKLRGDDNLNLTNKVIVIHGISRTENIPGTVSTMGDMIPQDILPIACGKIERIISEN